MPKQSGFQVTHNIRGSSTTSESDAIMLIRDKCEKYKRKLDAERKKNKKLAQGNKQLVQALEAAKAENMELKEAASRQLKIDSLYLPRLKSWLDSQQCSMSALLKDCARSTQLLEDIMTPGADISLTAEDSLQDEAAAPKPRPSLHPPGSRYCDEWRMSPVLEEDENDKTEDMELWRDSTGQLEEVQPEVTQFSGVTVRKRHHSGRHCSLPVMFRDLLDEPLDAPAFAVLDEGASSVLDEITGQENSIVRAETVLMPPPEKPKGHSADEYSVAFSHRPKIPSTPCRTEGHDGDAGLAPSSDDACSSPKERQQMQPRRVSEIPLLPWPRKPVDPQGSPKECVKKEFGTEVTNTLLLSPPRCVLDEALVEPPSSTQLPKGTTPSPERVGDYWGDGNGPPLAKIQHRQSANKSRAANGTKPKASGVTFVVKKRRGSVMHEDGAVGPMDDVASLPDPSVDGRWEEGCEDRPQGVDGTPQRQHTAAVNVIGPSAMRHRASLPKKQRGATEKRGKPRGKKWEGMKNTADIEEEPAPQPAAKKKPEGGKYRSRGGKKKAADTEEPTPHLAASAPKTTERQRAVGKSRVKKSHCREEQAPQPAVPASLPPPSRCAQHGGCTPPEPLDAAPATSSAENDSGSQCMPSGRPARTATKCASYKLASLSQKRRRP